MESEYYSQIDMYETIKDELDCPICKETFSHPKSLSCGHVFCFECLKLQVKADQCSDSLNCPTCRRPTLLPPNGVSTLPNNYHISNLVERLKLPQQRPTKASSTKAPVVDHMTRPESCEKHDRKMELFCNDCDTGICTACLGDGHKNHSLTGMENKIIEWTKSVKATIPVSHRILESASKATDKMKEEKQMLSEQKEKVLKSIKSYFTVLHEDIVEREKVMTEAVGKYYQQKVATIDGTLMPMDDESHTLSQYVASARSMANDTTNLSSVRKLSKAIKEHSTELQALVEKAEKTRLLDHFLSFTYDKAVQPQISEIGTLNECVVMEGDNTAGQVAAFRVKRKLLVRQGTTTLQLVESESSDSEDGVELYDDVPPNSHKENKAEDEIYDEVYEETQSSSKQIGLVPPPPLPAGRPASPNPHPPQQTPAKAEYGEFNQATSYVNFPCDLHSRIVKPVNTFVLSNAAGNLRDIIQPWGVAVSPNDTNIYITDTGNHCVIVLTTDGHLRRVIGARGNGRGQFLMPVDVALDEKSNIYVADRQNGCVQKFSSGGKFKVRFKQGESASSEPNGLAVFRNKVYVSDRIGSKIIIFDPQGSPLGTITCSLVSVGDNPFQPAGIAIHPKFEKIFVADRCNHQVLVFNNDGELVHNIGHKGHGQGQLLFPNGVAITSNDLLLVTETENNRVSVFDSKTGNFIKSFGKTGEQEGMFINPRHIATNIHGEVYVADEKNQRIQTFNIFDQDPAYIDIKENMYVK